MEKRIIKASGCLVLATDTGRILMQQRGAETNHPRTWCFFGGKSYKGERPIQTLKRELEEEIGMIPDMEKIIPVHQYTSGDKKFVYNTFIVLVQEEFLPVLNNESDGYAWIKVNNWPRPLHPGVKNQLFNKEFIKKVQTVIESNTSGILN